MLALPRPAERRLVQSVFRRAPIITRLPFLVLLAAALPAWAGGTATIAAADAQGPVELAWRDTETVRLDLAGQPGYMIVREVRAYMFSRTGGQAIVMDMASTARLLYGPGKPRIPATAANAAAVDTLAPTGRRETVADIEGEIYRVAWTDARGGERTDEAVLSEHPDALDMTAVLRSFTNAMASAVDVDNPDALDRELAGRGLGVLRFGRRFRVETLSAQAPDAAAFELPARP